MQLKLVGRGAVVACLLLLLAGCGPRDTRYFPKLKTASAVPVKKNQVTITTHPLSHEECEEYFGVDVISNGYFPFVMTIENNGPDAYVIRPSYFELPRVSGKKVSRLMHYDTYQRVVWMTIPALIFWWQAIPVLIVPYGLACRYYNDKTTRNIRKKTWGRTEVLYIAPYETIQKFVFVNESFHTTFDIKLYNETQQVLEIYEIDVSSAIKKS